MFLEHADDLYRQKDLLQASEKAWGAVAHCVSGIAREEGWDVGKHKYLVANAKRLFSRDPEHADRRLLLWQAVELLHAHFYQELLDEDTVGRSIEYAKELVEGFKSLAAQPESAIE
jgi:hypothetical protein